MLLSSIVIIAVALAILLIKGFRKTSREDRLALASRVVNARGLSDLVDKEMKRVSRSGDAFSLVYLEARDGDSHTGAMKQELLAAVAAILLEHLRETDFLARLDDGLAVFMPNTGKEGVQAVMRKIRAEVSRVAESEGWLSTFGATAVVYDQNSLQLIPVQGGADAVISQLTKGGKEKLQGTLLASQS